MDRGPLLREVTNRLGRRSLVWAGIRGDDIEPLADLPQLAYAFSLASAYRRSLTVESLAYEDISGVRVDPETWDMDDHLTTEATVAYRQAMLRSLARRSALLPYRPSRFLSAVSFARRDRCLNLGLFGAYQSAFEHKPWVESAIADLGLPHIPWVYIADEEQLQTRTLLALGPVMLRRSRTSGGEGFIRVEDPSELASQWPHIDESFVSVAPFLEGGTPVNVGATAWSDGVTVHYPSVQLIGIPECVTRPFGYCGNDFGLAQDLDDVTLGQIEFFTTRIGDWLRGFGYRGTFGVDFIIHDGKVLFTEINPRFQGSTHSSCRLSIEQGQSCLMLEHIAAILGVHAPRQVPLTDLMREVTPMSNVVVHWTGEESASLDPDALVGRVLREYAGSRADVLTRPSILTERGAAVARLSVRERVTETGFDLATPLRRMVAGWNREILGQRSGN